MAYTKVMSKSNAFELIHIIELENLIPKVVVDKSSQRPWLRLKNMGTYVLMCVY